MNNTQPLLPRLLPAAAATGAAALLVFVIFDTFNTYSTLRDNTQEDETILRSRTNAQTPASGINLKQIPGWHLFGDASRPSETSVKREIIEAPTTPLALTLQGTFLGTSSTGESWAIISSSDDAQAMYKVGDKIPGGAKLFAVEPFRVILERNGRHESLALPRPSMDENQQASMTETSQSPKQHYLPNAQPDSAPPLTQPVMNAETEKQALIEEMERLRKQFGR